MALRRTATIDIAGCAGRPRTDGGVIPWAWMAANGDVNEAEAEAEGASASGEAQEGATGDTAAAGEDAK